MQEDFQERIVLQAENVSDHIKNVKQENEIKIQIAYKFLQWNTKYRKISATK